LRSTKLKVPTPAPSSACIVMPILIDQLRVAFDTCCRSFTVVT
jgi:hypothetical protein